MIVVSLLLIAVAAVLLVRGLIGADTPALIGSIAASMLAAIALVAASRRARVLPPPDAPEDADAPYDPRRLPRRGPGSTIAGTRLTDVRTAPGGRDGRGESATGERWPEVTGRPVTDLAEERAVGTGEPAISDADIGEPDISDTAVISDTDVSTAVIIEPATVDAAEAGVGATAEAGGAVPTGATPAGSPADQGAGGNDEDPPDEPPQERVDPADLGVLARLATEVLVVDGRPRFHLPDCSHLVGREVEPLPLSEAIELEFTPCARCRPAHSALAGLTGA